MVLETTVALDRDRLRSTVDAIASVQQHDGSIPEFPGGVTNPWNHIEAAMSLDIGGLHQEAERAYNWLVPTQREDGAWPAGFLGAEVVDRTRDTNFCSYIAFGVWHHFLCTGDRSFLAEMMPAVDRAMGFTLGMQRRDGTMAWARDARGRRARTALLTSSACIVMSLRSAQRIATELRCERAEWELAQQRLESAIGRGDHLFQPKARFSMDWYYPILARTIESEAAERRLAARWDEFVVPNLGARCVVDRPWVTSGETAELALALCVMGRRDEANEVLGWVEHLRADDDHYWIGATFPDGTVWPQQKPTWGSAAVVMAADALAGGPTAAAF